MPDDINREFDESGAYFFHGIASLYESFPVSQPNTPRKLVDIKQLWV
jgi:hypothetical protein